MQDIRFESGPFRVSPPPPPPSPSSLRLLSSSSSRPPSFSPPPSFSSSPPSPLPRPLSLVITILAGQFKGRRDHFQVMREAVGAPWRQGKLLIVSSTVRAHLYILHTDHFHFFLVLVRFVSHRTNWMLTLTAGVSWLPNVRTTRSVSQGC